MSERRILLLGSYGRGNIGDDAFLLAAMNLFPEAELYINSANDELLPAEAKNHVTTISTIGFGDFWKKLKVFWRINHIVYCGGDLWVQLYGDKFPRLALYKMLVVNTVARLCGKKVHYLGCGVGKLHGYSLFLARLSARLANSVAVREARSARVLGLNKVVTLPDLTINLPDDLLRPNPSKGRKKVIGISLLYFVPDPAKNFPQLLDALAVVLNSLPEKEYRFILYPMLVSGEEPKDDFWACTQLQKKAPNADVTIFESRDIGECIRSFGQLDLLVGARLHANILSTLIGTPCVGVSYRPKVGQFFVASALSDYYVELRDVKQLEPLVRRILHNLAKARAEFKTASQQIKKKRVAYQTHIRENF